MALSDSVSLMYKLQQVQQRNDIKFLDRKWNQNKLFDRCVLVYDFGQFFILLHTSVCSEDAK